VSGHAAGRRAAGGEQRRVGAVRHRRGLGDRRRAGVGLIMPIVYTEESEYARELAKWEQFPTRLTASPGNPFRYRPYPKMLHRAQRLPSGQVGCPLPMTSISDADAEAFAKRGQLIVYDEAQERAAYLEGWRLTYAEAIAAFEAQQQAIATAAAEVA